MGITKPIDDFGAGTGPPGEPRGGLMPGIGGGCGKEMIFIRFVVLKNSFFRTTQKSITIRESEFCLFNKNRNKICLRVKFICFSYKRYLKKIRKKNCRGTAAQHNVCKRDVKVVCTISTCGNRLFLFPRSGKTKSGVELRHSHS